MVGEGSGTLSWLSPTEKVRWKYHVRVEQRALCLHMRKGEAQPHVWVRTDGQELKLIFGKDWTQGLRSELH